MSEPVSSQTPASSPAPAPRRRTLVIVAVALAAGLTGAVATAAVGATAMSHYGFGPGWHGGWRGGFGRAPLSPAEVEQRADRAVRHLAVEIDASADQQEKLRTIVRGAVKDLLPLREQMRADRQRAIDLLTGPSVDRGAIERFRAERLAIADTASKRIAQGLADMAEALTPEQRRQIGERANFLRRFGPGGNP
jgi:Spy/CpxP family protein refolding chaperone